MLVCADLKNYRVFNVSNCICYTKEKENIIKCIPTPKLQCVCFVIGLCTHVVYT